MDIGQGSLSSTQSFHSASGNSGAKVDINTENLQKVVLSTQEQISEQARTQEEGASKSKEPTSPLQHLLGGNEKDAKQELLKDFISKIAGSEQDILFSGDKGRKDVELLNEFKLLFGQEAMKEDEVILSSNAKMAKMTDAVTQSQAAAALRKEMTKEEDSKKADKLEKLEKQIFDEKSGVREKLSSEKMSKPNLKEDSERNIENFDKSKYSEEDLDQDSSGRNKGNQQEVEDEDTLAISKLKQKATDDVQEEVEDEDIVDEMEEVEVEEAQKKDTKSSQVVGTKERGIEEDKNVLEQSKLEKPEKISETPKEKQLTSEEMIAKYTDHYKKYLMLPNKDLDSFIKSEESLLREFGFTSRQVKDIQQAIKKTIKQEIRSKIEDAIIQKQLSMGNKLDSLVTDTKLNKFTDFFVSNLLLGGQDFGGFDESFQGMVNKAMYFASKSLANFSVEEMEDFVIQESLDPSKTKIDKIRDFESRVNELNSITNNPKITEEWAQTAMEVFMKDYGLAKEKLDIPEQSSGNMINVMSGETGFSQNQQQQQKHGYEFDSKDEKDIFLNRLRALYLQRALNPGLSTSLKTEFKIRKLKNGLLRMGIFTEVLNEQIQQEAGEVAKERTLEMLKEALEERSSLYELKGTAYDLLENKIKGILKNADKLGLEISKDKFEKMRDEINYRMLEITKKQMELIEVRLSEADFPQLVVKYREMQKLIDRLKEESGIEDSSVGNEKFHNITIAESA